MYTSQVSLTIRTVLKFGLKHLRPFRQIILDFDKYPIICGMKSLICINYVQSAFSICWKHLWNYDIQSDFTSVLMIIKSSWCDNKKTKTKNAAYNGIYFVSNYKIECSSNKHSYVWFVTKLSLFPDRSYVPQVPGYLKSHSLTPGKRSTCTPSVYYRNSIWHVSLD